MGLARAVPRFGDAARNLGIHPVEAGGVAFVRRNEGERHALARAAYREFRSMAQPEVRVARLVRRDVRPGCGVVHGPVLCALLPAEHAEGRLRPVVHARRCGAVDRHAVLRGVRPFVRSHRQKAHHRCRLCRSGADAVPDLSRPYALRESRVGRIRAARRHRGGRARLSLQPLRQANDAVRPRARFSDEGGLELRVGAVRRNERRRHDDRRRATRRFRRGGVSRSARSAAAIRRQPTPRASTFR